MVSTKKCTKYTISETVTVTKCILYTYFTIIGSYWSVFSLWSKKMYMEHCISSTVSTHHIVIQSQVFRPIQLSYTTMRNVHLVMSSENKDKGKEGDTG